VKSDRFLDVLWRRNLHFLPSSSSVAFDHSGVFLVERRTRLVKVDPLNGVALWSLPIFNKWGTLEVNASCCVYLDGDRVLRCIDRDSGSIRWATKRDWGCKHLAIAGDSIISGGWRGYTVLHAFDPHDGLLKWSWSNKPKLDYVAPVSIGNSFYTSVRGSRVLLQVDANSGDVIGDWSLSDPIASGDSDPAFGAIGEDIYFRTGESGVSRLVAGQVETLWNHSNELSVAPPRFFGAKALVTGKSGLFVLDLNGSPAREVASQSPVAAGIAPIEAGAIVGLRSGHVVEIDPDGAKSRRQHLAERVTMVGSGSPGVIYVATKGELLACSVNP
jgi:outer membrane protein assembly factor BamB